MTSSEIGPIDKDLAFVQKSYVDLATFVKWVNEPGVRQALQEAVLFKVAVLDGQVDVKCFTQVLDGYLKVIIQECWRDSSGKANELPTVHGLIIGAIAIDRVNDCAKSTPLKYLPRSGVLPQELVEALLRLRQYHEQALGFMQRRKGYLSALAYELSLAKK